jgi:hypothetical protein
VAKALSFIENVDGNLVSKQRGGHVCRQCYAFFYELLQTGMIPKTWGTAPMSIKEKFAHEILKKAPELMLCLNGWKIEKVGSEVYSQWTSSLKKRKWLEEPPDGQHGTLRVTQIGLSGSKTNTHLIEDEDDLEDNL